MKNLRILTCLLLCGLSLACFSSLRAQEEPLRSRLSMNAGFSQTFAKDLNFSPLNYRGQGNVYGLGYERTTRKQHIFFARLDATLTDLSTASLDTDRFPAKFYALNLEIGYLRRLKIDKENWKFYLGGQYHTAMDLTFFDGTEAISFFGHHALDLGGRADFTLKKRHHFSASLSLPLLGLLVRPPYTGWDRFIGEHAGNPLPVFFRGKIATVNEMLGLNAALTYRFSLSKSWEVGARYDFRYLHTTRLDQATLASNQLSLQATLKF